MCQARKFDTAAKWADILTDEFSNQGLMEQELQMPSCLFGGPPVRDDIIKLGESQIGFMNIFARPLFEAVTDILPEMRFAVDEILTNKGIWEGKIDEARKKKRKNPNFSLGLPPSTFSADPMPSPRSNVPMKVSSPPVASGLSKSPLSNETGRRGSSGSFHAVLAGSRRSSLGVDKSPGQQTPVSRENQNTSRRGSGDPSLTAILVTQNPNFSESSPKGMTPSPEDRSRGDRKDTLTSPSSKKRDMESARPVTAPSQARRNPGMF
jgi:hypothetical protein